MGKMETIEITVDGMSCAHCEKRVATALLRLDGVKEAKASAGERTVTVTFDADSLGVERLREAILGCGYTPQ